MSRWITVPDFDSGLLSARPTAEFEGRYYYGTDTQIIYYDNGTTWDDAALGVEVNDLATDGIAGIADNQLAVGTGADAAEYQSLTTGAVKFDTGTGAFTQAASSDLSDMATKTGTGTEVVMSGSPTIVTPTIASMANATHDHADAAGGGQLGTTALTDDAVTYAKMQNVVADDVVLGNIGGAGGIVDELTGTEVTALLDEFAKDSSTQGVVPASDNSTSKFLRADGTWVVPSGGGDLTSDGTTAQDAALFTERADHVNTPGTGLAELWIKSDTTQTPMFTDELGSDHAILKTLSTTNNGVLTQSYTAGVSNGANAETDLLYTAGELQLEHATTSSVRVSERASGPTGVAGKGHYWTRSDAPSTPMFTDDTDNDHVLAPKLYMRFTIEDPVAGDNFIDLGVVDVACTVTKVYHYFRGAGTSIQWQMAHGTNPTSGANLFSSSITTNTKTSIGSETTGFNDALLAAGETMWLDAGTLVGAVDLLHITVVYTED